MKKFIEIRLEGLYKELKSINKVINQYYNKDFKFNKDVNIQLFIEKRTDLLDEISFCNNLLRLAEEC